MFRLGPALAFAACIYGLAAQGAVVCDRDAKGLVPRTILGLYDARRDPDVRDTRLHKFIEFPLNFFGFTVRYVDVSDGRLPETVGEDVAGAVSWFDGPLADPHAFASWAGAISTDCPDAFSFIVFGQTGLPVDRPLDRMEAAYLRRLGVERTDRSVLLGDFTAVAHVDGSLVGRESDFVFRPGRYASLRSISREDAMLTVARPGAGTGDGIDLLVLHGPNAYVEESATLDADSRAGGYFWIVDPYELVRRTLSPVPRPIADVTTLNGRRIYFETVGPEGWLAQAPIRTFDEDPRLGSENLKSTLLDPFPNLPVSISVAVGDISPDIGGKPAVKGREVAKEIYRLPQALVATSGRSLVRYWKAVDTVQPGPKIPLPEEVPASADETGQLLSVLGQSIREAFSEPGAPAEPQLSDGVRKYGEDAFDVDQETAGALATVKALVPDEAVMPLFLWSGDGRPTTAALAAVHAAGAEAIGGGAATLGQSNSISALAPLSARVGGLLQVYNALPGDLSDPGYPSANAHALHDLGLLLDRTDKPLRLKPVQIAYSAGTANQFGTRSAIERLKTLVSGSNGIIPVSAAEYVRIVRGFETVRFQSAGVNRWVISERGSLQTVRFDDLGALSLDLDASDGVVGARRINGSIYVSLDPGAPSAVVALVHDASPSGMVLREGDLGLSETNLSLTSTKKSPCAIALTGSGWGAGSATFYGEPDTTYRLSVTAAPPGEVGAELAQADAISDAKGRVTFAVPTLQGRPETLTIWQECAG